MKKLLLVAFIICCGAQKTSDASAVFLLGMVVGSSLSEDQFNAISGQSSRVSLLELLNCMEWRHGKKTSPRYFEIHYRVPFHVAYVNCMLRAKDKGAKIRDFLILKK